MQFLTQIDKLKTENSKINLSCLYNLYYIDINNVLTNANTLFKQSVNILKRGHHLL